MSILIKGMEMPIDGKAVTLTICADGITFEEFKEIGNVFHAIPVPPHGRLIDADALKNTIKDEADFLDANCGEDEHSFKFGSLSAYWRAIGCVGDAPTIIEAERG